MNNHERYAKTVLDRYIQGKATAKEIKWVESFLLGEPDHQYMVDQDLAEKHLASIWMSLNSEITPKRPIKLIKIISVAACLILALIPMHFYYSSTNQKNLKLAKSKPRTVLSTENQTLLTINGGNTLPLDSIPIGTKIEQNGVIISKNSDGTIAYQTTNSQQRNSVPVIHTITTPRSKQHRIQLPDNSIVWVNANSRIQFPIPFPKNCREISISGEGYFDIQKNADKPFLVSSAGQQVIVKGTKFNVSAYPNEKESVTTLLEGAIDIKTLNTQSKNSKTASLVPNDQIIVEGNNFEKKKVNALEYIDWKNPKFNFNDTPLKDVMTRISRWYDVEVIYLENLDQITFTGSLSKFENIEDVLRKISHTESVHFEIKERRIIVKR
ncbi:FecR family protein [Sphingobacterium hotanense]|uniref:FecR family protein n=1 Tax=Sphingobacterium hotanense TaxID=649196 RepID=UPI0021A2D253|nr:FecR family protein [Sphingobacterium hotanense]MCT1523883.1 FecR family protein [Sphingobacterium hotanense]